MDQTLASCQFSLVVSVRLASLSLMVVCPILLRRLLMPNKQRKCKVKVVDLPALMSLHHLVPLNYLAQLPKLELSLTMPVKSLSGKSLTSKNTGRMSSRPSIHAWHSRRYRARDSRSTLCHRLPRLTLLESCTICRSL